MMLNNALYLDGGVLLNLCATGRAAMIMQDLPYQCVTIQEVAAEEFFFGMAQQADQFHQTQHQFCSVSDLIAQGILEVRPFLMEQYYRDYVACSVRLPDTLARLLTLAKTEEASLATDDGCLQQMIKEFIPTMPIHSTPDLLQRWQDMRAISDVDLMPLIRQVAHFAQFTPSPGSLHVDWWDGFLTDPQQDE